MLHVLLLLACAVVIYLACEWFVNAVEWLGAQLQVGPVAVGTVLAAVGTALPESVVTLVAVLPGRSGSGHDIAVGAALGGPLVVGTLAYAVTGSMLLLRSRLAPVPAEVPVGTPVGGSAAVGPEGDSMPHEQGAHGQAALGGAGAAAPRNGALDDTDTAGLAGDQTWFLGIFTVKVALGLVAFAWKPWLALLFVAAYAVYFWRETRSTGEVASTEGLEPLRLQPRRAVPSGWAVLLQTAITLVVVFGASQVFVGQLEWAGPALGLPAVVVALLLSPVATELPEIMNAIIWVRQGKTQLALANISGAMMIQATVPSAIGIALTPWLFDTPLVLAGLATLASVVYLRWLFGNGRATPGRLAGAAAFYGLFAVGLVVSLS